jgi:hypothetical protein
MVVSCGDCRAALAALRLGLIGPQQRSAIAPSRGSSAFDMPATAISTDVK